MTQYVGIRELNHRTGEFIRAAAAGERITVTERGRPIVDLVPHEQAGGFAALVAAGLLDKEPRPRSADAPPIPVFSGSFDGIDEFIHGTDEDEVWWIHTTLILPLWWEDSLMNQRNTIKQFRY